MFNLLHIQYMEQEGASDLMQMWLAADNFQQQLTSTSTSGCYDPEQAQNDAMVIYDRWAKMTYVYYYYSVILYYKPVSLQ